MEQLTALYKYRNNGEATGLDALIAGSREGLPLRRLLGGDLLPGRYSGRVHHAAHGQQLC
jgi:hypothetical protein